MHKMNLYKSLVILVLSSIFFSCEKEKLEYTIHGKLDNVKGDVFYAARESGDSLKIDTIQINSKGEFSFTAPIDTLTVVSLYFKDVTESPYVLVDRGWNVEVKGNGNTPDLILAKGGEINDDLTKFKTENINLIKARTAIVEETKTPGDKEDSIVVSKQSNVELNNVNFELLNVASEYIKNNPTKIASVMLINNFFQNEESLERLTEALGSLKGAAYDFPIAVQLRAYRDQLKKSSVNAYAPSINLKDVNGKDRTLNEFRQKYVLLIFESTTCPLCIELRPQMAKEYDLLKKEKMNIEFVSIVKDIEEEPISDKLKKDTKWVMLPEYGGWSSTIFEEYNIKEIPYNILISRDGKILERDIPIFNLKHKLEGQPGIKTSSSKK